MDKPAFPLSRKALLSIIVILLPILVTFVYGYRKNREHLERYALEDLTIIAEAYEGQVYQFLEMVKRRTLDFSSDGFISDSLEKIVEGEGSDAKALTEHLRRNKLPLDEHISAISIITHGGLVVASTDPSAVGKDVSGTAFFVQGRHGVAVVDYAAEKPVLAVSAPVVSKTRRVPLGVITNFVMLSELNSILTGEFSRRLGAVSWKKGARKTSEAYIVNGDKLMIAGSEFGQAASRRVDTLPVNSCLSSGEEVSSFYTNYRGGSVAGASMCFPSLGWTLVVEVERDEVLAPVIIMRRDALKAGFAVTGLIGLLFVVFSRTVVYQLRKISTGATKLAGGDYDIAIPVSTRDEIGTLSESFNRMASEIRERDRTLARTLESLKKAQRVARMGSWDWDVERNGLWWSDEIYRIFGLEPYEFGATYEAFLKSVHPEDRDSVKGSVWSAFYERKPYSIDHRVIRPDGRVRVVHEEAEVSYDEEGKPVRMVGTVQDITERVRAEEEERRRLDRIARQHSALLEISTRVITPAYGLESILKFIIKLSGETLGVERVGLWLLADDRERLDCFLLYESSKGRISRGGAMRAGDCPGFFSALEAGRAVDAGTAQEDERTRELRENYLLPNGITSFLGAPVRMGGELRGILSYEHTGKERRWTDDEVRFAAEAADQAAQAFSEDKRRKTEFELKKLSAAIEQIVNIVLLTDVDGKIEYVNPMFEKVTGYTEEEVLGLTPKILSSGETPREKYEELWKTILAGNTWRGVFKNKKKNGVFYWCNTVISPIRDDGEITHFLAIQEDITEKTLSEERLANLAVYDDVTGLLNRGRFVELLNQWIHKARRGGDIGILFLIDVDHFKFINDTYGHAKGDVFLRRLAKVFTVTLERMCEKFVPGSPARPITGRLSGDEFAVFVPGVGAKTGLDFAEALRKEAEDFSLEEGYGSSTISTGVVLYPEHGVTTRELLTRADAAMYRAKRLGRNRSHLFRPEDHDLEKMHSRLHWKEKIASALRDGRFDPWFQPILDLKKRGVHHYEVLARMRGEGGEILLPGSFIDVAERFGLITSIDRMIIEKTVRLHRLLKENGKDLFFSVNLSGINLGDEDFLAWLKDKVRNGGSNLVFEITETAAVREMEGAKKFIDALKTLGCSFSLDDFGVGFTSFTYLKEMDVDFIKIDGSFIRRLHENPEDQLFVKAITDVAKGLGIKTIAEFVEKEETLELIKEYDVDFAQGFLIGRPGPPRGYPVKELERGG